MLIVMLLLIAGCATNNIQENEANTIANNVNSSKVYDCEHEACKYTLACQCQEKYGF